MRTNTVLSRDEIPMIMLKAIIGHSYSEIAEEFMVGKSTIGDIVNGRTWKDVGSPRRIEKTDFYAFDDGRVINIKNKNLTPTRVSVDKQSKKKYITASVNGIKKKIFI